MTGTVEASLIEGDAPANAVKVPTREASQIAAAILGAVRHAYEVNGGPSYSKGQSTPTLLTTIAPSGYAVGPGPRPDQTVLSFYFGDTALGIRPPKSHANALAKQMMLGDGSGG